MNYIIYVSKIAFAFLFTFFVFSSTYSQETDTVSIEEEWFENEDSVVLEEEIPLENEEDLYDSASVNVKYPDENTLSDFKKDRDFNYETEPPQGSSLWDNILYWIYMQILNLFSDKGVYPYIRWAIIIAFLVFIVLRILDVNVFSFFYSASKKANIGIFKIDEDITKADIDSLIQKAKTEGDFRMAVRLLFLKLLKLLHLNHFIDWKQHKTNADYSYEISKHGFALKFKQLKYIYEYIWYGDFILNIELYQSIESDFDDAFTQIFPNVPKIAL